MILTLITVGKMSAETRSKGKTTDALKSLMAGPKTATLVRDGAEVTVAIADVRRATSFVVRPARISRWTAWCWKAPAQSTRAP